LGGFNRNLLKCVFLAGFMDFEKGDYSGVVDRQSYVSKSGRAWELHVMDFLNKEFEEESVPLKVIDGKKLKKHSVLWDALAIPVGEGKTSTKIEGDVDLVVVNKNDLDKPLAVISCKTSLHGRFSETLFYAVVWKQMIPNIVVVFSTPDKGRQAKKGEWASEWGSEEKPTKDRLLEEHYLNGVYIGNENTKIGGGEL